MRYGKLIFALCLFLSPVLAEETHYSAEEIEGLAAKNAWSDAMLRLPEVATGERGKGWDSLVERVAVGYLRTLSDEDPNNAMAIMDTLPQTYPSLQRSGKYRDAVESVAYTGFKSCFLQKESQAECTKNVKDYVTKHVNAPDRAGSRFCKDETMKLALGELCPTRKTNPKGKRTKP